MSKLLEHLPQNGWALLSQCVTFDDITPTKMKFWDQCASKLNWNVVCTEAEPLLDAWSAYIAQSLLGHYRQSLYFNISNVLLTILIFMNKPPKTLDISRVSGGRVANLLQFNP